MAAHNAANLVALGGYRGIYAGISSYYYIYIVIVAIPFITSSSFKFPNLASNRSAVWG